MEINDTKIIADILENIYDWESDDLKKDFVSYLSQETKVSGENLAKIFDSYDSLPALERASITFDTRSFVEQFI